MPGIRGRIVVTTAMFAALTAAERDVLLAHEAAHLNHRHHLWIQFVELAAVANPLLRRLPPVVRHAAERWADEDAAHWMSMGGQVRLACSSGTARDGLDVSPPDGLFELVALVVAGRRDRRERAAPVRAEQ